MKAGQAIILTIALIIVGGFLSASFHTGLIAQWLVVISSLWVAIDSSKLQLKKYKTGIAYPPVILFIAVCLVWVIGFPWYLSVRYKIKNGLLPLKEPGVVTSVPTK
jgi:hypothetical protein